MLDKFLKVITWTKRFTVQGKTGPEEIDVNIGKIEGGIGIEVKAAKSDWEYYLGRAGLPLEWFSRFMSEGPWWWKRYRQWRNLDPRKEDTDNDN